MSATHLPAFETIPAPRPGPVLFLCDHASNAVPPAYGTLGLPEAEFKRHIASDIGAGDLTRALAAAFDAPALLGVWSRLLVNLNRGPDDPTLVMKISDGALIPGNARADAAEIAHRIAAFHAPYHAAIEAEIVAAMAAGFAPSLVSMHSFTPVWRGDPRPWQIGILWDRDDRLVKPLIAAFEAAGLVTGDNEPYDGALEGDTLWTHATSRGLPNVLIEVRQDLIADPAGVARMTPIVASALRQALASLT
ncbi:MAG: N-formylglutamate amidohydrolase [Micropepsaceae bacterium]